MPRRIRNSLGGEIYHALNRSGGRFDLFRGEHEFEQFQELLFQAQRRFKTRLLAWCLMPDHFHLVLWPKRDGELSRFMGWLTLAHTQRLQHARGKVGRMKVYESRFRSFPVQRGAPVLEVIRYVESGPLRKRLVKRAEQWRWCSLRVAIERGPAAAALARCPVPRPANWPDLVNHELDPARLAELRACAQRGRPYGAQKWQRKAAVRMGLASTFRSPGRPRKAAAKRGKSQ